MKPPPLRLRIALLSTLLSGAVMVMFGAGAWWAVARQKTEALDARIRALGTRQPGWMLQDGNFRRLEENLDFVISSPGDRARFFLLVVDGRGGVLHQSNGWPEGLDPVAFTGPMVNDPNANSAHRGETGNTDETGGPGGHGWGGPGRGRGPGGGQPLRFTKVPEFSDVSSGGHEWRVGRLGSDELTLVIGLSAEANAAELRQLRGAAAIALPAALMMIGFGGWLVAGRALLPLRTITDTASRVTSHGLDQRIPALGGDPEITRLVDMLNRMMDRLEAGFRQAIRFSADASHELKTPLAIMRGEIEQALQGAAPGSPDQRTLSSLLEETHRLGNIIRSLLLLSRADAGRLVTTSEPIDLTAVAGELAEDTSLSAEPSGIRVKSELAAGLRIRGDAALLRTAILNLLTNSVKHNRPGGNVTVLLTENDGRAMLEVSNTAAAIPQDECAAIFERFRRGRDARDHARDGVGLGLSLAREIIVGHGGTLELAEDRGEGMVRFIAILPLG